MYTPGDLKPKGQPVAGAHIPSTGKVDACTKLSSIEVGEGIFVPDEKPAEGQYREYARGAATKYGAKRACLL